MTNTTTEILTAHARWLAGDPTGRRADLRRANLSDAVLRRADLSRAVLSDANLSDANLRGANLSLAVLSDADLRRADLSRAVLRRANLRRAVLRRANLSGADLSLADLSGADLSDANLSLAVLSDADLRRANLSGAIGLPDLRLPGLAALVLAQIEGHPETHDQRCWHSECGTRHCAAGWCTTIARVPPEIEDRLGTRYAALLALGLSPSATAPFGADDDPLPWLRGLADAERAGLGE